MPISIILLLIVGALIVLFVALYNGLIQRRVAADNAWSQIDIQLKRRHDLVPNLVETVKGYAGHESATFERVIQARNSAVTSGSSGVGASAQAEAALSGALRQIFALSENYPQLKANENFLKLQEELSSTENRIGFARQHYNDCVAIYNTAIQTIPSNLVASLGGFQVKEFFQLDSAEVQAVRQTPKVSF